MIEIYSERAFLAPDGRTTIYRRFAMDVTWWSDEFPLPSGVPQNQQDALEDWYQKNNTE